MKLAAVLARLDAYEKLVRLEFESRNRENSAKSALSPTITIVSGCNSRITVRATLIAASSWIGSSRSPHR